KSLSVTNSLPDFSALNAQKTFTQEVRLASTHGGSIQWTAGGNYTHSRQRQTIGATHPALGHFIALDEKTANKEWAVFGELHYLALDDRLKLTGGLRYTESRRRILALDELISLPALQALGLPNPVRQKFTEFVPRFNISYKWSD